MTNLFNAVIGKPSNLDVVAKAAGVKHQGNGKFTGFVATKFADGFIAVTEVIVNADTVYEAQAFAQSQV